MGPSLEPQEPKKIHWIWKCFDDSDCFLESVQTMAVNRLSDSGLF